MTDQLPASLSLLSMVGILALMFLIGVLIFQGACYFCRIEKPTFGKASLVLLASYICGFCILRVMHVEQFGLFEERSFMAFVVTTGITVLLLSLMMQLTLLDALRLHITTWLVSLTAAVGLVLAVIGGAMLLDVSSKSGQPAASIPASITPVEPSQAGPFFSAAQRGESDEQPRGVRFNP